MHKCAGWVRGCVGISRALSFGAWLLLHLWWMSANFKPKQTAVASRGFSAMTWLSCSKSSLYVPIVKKIKMMMVITTTTTIAIISIIKANISDTITVTSRRADTSLRSVSSCPCLLSPQRGSVGVLAHVKPCYARHTLSARCASGGHARMQSGRTAERSDIPIFTPRALRS